jgi:hypothetical protein
LLEVRIAGKKQPRVPRVKILCMKLTLTLLVASVFVGLAGCRDPGYNDQSANNTLTPEASETQQVRTYDQKGNPAVTTAPIPAWRDPSSPDYEPPDSAR